MPINPRIIDILARYEELAEQGQTPAAGELCRDCPELAAEVDRRIQGLKAVPSPDGITECPAPDLAKHGDVPPASPSPWVESLEPHADTRIGPYKLVQKIGEGGMGSVWMAEQTEPVRRTVALKLIKPGNNDQQFLNRFAVERQALALMDHPNIARVLDAGTVERETGHAPCPYFVMELVKGIPITKYCDHHKLTLRQRLELFTLVCHAIQHAHQKGIIHRDIKPSNVLVASYDGIPVPKVIDFGVAKATGLKLTDSSLVTQFGTIVGTLEYMSPEQTDANILDIDTRSDIYALGVLLYELLTGTTPVTSEQMAKEALYEIVRCIREAEPPPPSSRLSHSGPKLAAIAAQRDSDPAKLAKMVRGELDWLVMKALEKDRDRRYETASAFALDVQRYLHDEPVLARPPSATYRLRKFAKRHKGALTASAMLLLALVGGIIGTTWGLVQAQEQRDLAVQAQQAESARTEGERQAKQEALAAAEAEKKAIAQAQKRLAQLEKANDLMTSIFDDVDIRQVREGTEPLEAVLAERLVKAASQLEGEAVGEPLAVARLQERLAVTLRHLGYPREATVLFAKTVETRKALLTSHHRDTLWAMHLLGASYNEAGNVNQALPLLEETLRLMTSSLGAEDTCTVDCMNSLAVAYRQIGKAKQALPLYETTVKLQTAKYGASNLRTLKSRVNLATCQRAVGKLNLAIPLLEDTVELLKEKVGAAHQDTLWATNNLASAYLADGKDDLALQLYEENLDLAKRSLGQYHADTLLSMNNLANCYRRVGRLDEALPLMEQTVKLTKAKLGTDHPRTFTALANLALCYREDGKQELAIPLFEEAAVGLEGQRFQHEQARAILRDLVDCCEASGKLNIAEAWQRKWVAVVKERSGSDSTGYANELATLGWNLLQQKKWTDTEPVLRACLAIREKTQPDSWTTFNTLSMLGGALLGQVKVIDAEPLLLKAYDGLKQRASKIPGNSRTLRLAEAVQRLVALYKATGNDAEAGRWQKELDALKIL